MHMAVKRLGVEVLSRSVLPLGIGGVGFDHSQSGHPALMYKLCLPAERSIDTDIFAAPGANVSKGAKDGRDPPGAGSIHTTFTH